MSLRPYLGKHWAMTKICFVWMQLLRLCWMNNNFTGFVKFKPVKQEVSRIVILPPCWVFSASCYGCMLETCMRAHELWLPNCGHYQGMFYKNLFVNLEKSSQINGFAWATNLFHDCFPSPSPSAASSSSFVHHFRCPCNLLCKNDLFAQHLLQLLPPLIK